jgi:hypothetical protein
VTHYYILETTGSDVDGLNLTMHGEDIEAESRRKAVKKFLADHSRLNPEKVKQADVMEEQHYMAIPADEVGDGWFGHPENPAIHPVLGE